MSNHSIFNPYMLAQLINMLLLLIVVSAPILSLTALWHLRRCHLRGIELALWVLIILIIPILGATAAFITLDRHHSQNLHSA